MNRQLFKVTNVGIDVRAFDDRHSGKHVELMPKESVFTTSPPEKSEQFRIEETEKKTKKQKLEDE